MKKVFLGPLFAVPLDTAQSRSLILNSACKRGGMRRLSSFLIPAKHVIFGNHHLPDGGLFLKEESHFGKPVLGCHADVQLSAAKPLAWLEVLKLGTSPFQQTMVLVETNG